MGLDDRVAAKVHLCSEARSAPPKHQRKNSSLSTQVSPATLVYCLPPTWMLLGLVSMLAGSGFGSGGTGFAGGGIDTVDGAHSTASMCQRVAALCETDYG